MKLLVVGAGSIGRRHIRNLSVPAREMDLVLSVVEPDDTARRAVCGEWGLSGYKETAEAFDKETFEAALICAPSHLHIPLAQEAADAGCHLFIEKPLSTTLDGIEKLASTLRRTGKTCLVACNMWFHPGVSRLRELLASGEIGEPRLFRSYWGHHVAQWHPGADLGKHYSLNKEQGGGSLFDVGAHEFFFVPKLLGGIKRAVADTGPSGFLDADVDDYSHTLTVLENGVAGSFCFNFLDRCRRRSLEIVGERATAVWLSEGKNPIRERLGVYPGNGPWKEIPLNPLADVMYEETLKHFFRCVAGEEEPIQSLGRASKVLKLILSLKQSGEYRA